VTFSPDGRLLATAGDDTDRTVRLWEVATGGVVATFDAQHCAALALNFSRDGRMLATGHGDAAILLWDVTGHADRGRLRRASVSAARFAQLGENLGDDDAAVGNAAVWELVAAGPGIVPALKARLAVPRALDARRAEALVAAMDADDFATRQKATEEAEKLGLGAEPALRKALAGRPGLEPRKRVEAVVGRWLRSADWLRFRRAVAVLEREGSAEARQLLRALAAGAPGARPTKEAEAALGRR
jgi:hypothetical protein